MKKTFTLLATALTVSVFAQTTTFNYTGTPQYFVVPPNITLISLDVRGAEGGHANNLTQQPTTASGGLGGRVQCYLTVNPGDTLWIYVGQQGLGNSGTLTCDTADGGYNGGGNGYSGYNSFNYNSGGGGGATDIRIGGQTLLNRVIVAGGGGGGGCSGCTGGGHTGGAGGNIFGADGQDGTCTPGCNQGRGGTPTAGGANGNWACQCTVTSTAGSLGSGGQGDNSGCGVTCGSGGGGGGGYYGGGGGSLGPGGGGSSYTDPILVTGVLHTQGFQIGDGEVIVDFGPTVSTPENIIASSFSFYPNPAADVVNLKFNGIKDGKGIITLYDIAGKKVGEWNWNGKNSQEISVTGISHGSYIMKFESGAVSVSKLFTKK